MQRGPVTPSSLKWLIDRRARLSGEIEKVRRQQSAFEAEASAAIKGLQVDLSKAKQNRAIKQSAYDCHLQSLQAMLAAMDMVIQQHEVPVDPALIRAIREHENPAIGKRGHVTRLIFQCLRSSDGNPKTTTEIASYVASRLTQSRLIDDFAQFKYQIRKRLGHLVWEGRMDRVHAAQTSVEGRWRLPRATSILQAPQTPQPDDGLASSPSTTVRDRSQISAEIDH